MRVLALAVASFAVLVVEGCGSAGGPAGATALIRTPGDEAGMTSGDWGDGGWLAQRGMFLGYVPGRRFSLVFTVHNRTSRPVELVAAGGNQRAHTLLRRVATQFRLAPPPPPGDFHLEALRRWSAAPARPLAVPPGREAWVQFDFVMRGACRWFDAGTRETIDRATVIRYRAGGHEVTQAMSLTGDQVTVTLPATGCAAAPKAWQRLFADVYDGRLEGRWPCSTIRDAIGHLPADGPMYSAIPGLLEAAARRACRR